MPDADVTPNGNWDVAQDATVQVIGGAAINNVPIVNIGWTPAMITIEQKKYRNGVIILNENPPPGDANPISTQGNPTLNLNEEQKSQRILSVPIVRNAGWPTGEIILWK